MPQGGAVVIASLGIWSRLMIGYPRPKQKETRVTTADLLTKLFSRPRTRRGRGRRFLLTYRTRLLGRAPLAVNSRPSCKHRAFNVVSLIIQRHQIHH